MPPTEAQSQALMHYERGRGYYAAGRYRSAINEHETAIALDPSGFNLYFDLGLVYERVGMVDEALGAYRHYLEHVTDPAERDRADRIVSRVQGARVELHDLQARYGRADVWFWAFAAASMSSLATGGILLVAGLREPMAPASNGVTVTGEALLIAGGGLAVAATLLYFTRLAPPRYLPRCITAGADAHGARVGLSFSF
jgi:tetratricopeptide (TPR) repeat protein